MSLRIISRQNELPLVVVLDDQTANKLNCEIPPAVSRSVGRSKRFD